MTDKKRPLRLMIIDDEVGLLEMYKAVLPKDWILDLFSDARKAILNYSSESNYDVVITDLKMAPKNGESLIFDIKYINPYQKIIVLSGNAADLNLPESFNVRVFQKPWNVKNIMEVLHTWESDTALYNENL